MNLLKQFDLVPHVCSTMPLNSVFGKATVLAIGKAANTYRYYGVCRCECGNLCKIRLDMLLSGNTRSCGCLHKETITIHGKTKHPLFSILSGMLRRCENKKDKRYNDYGGRGITVCERWHDINLFIEDMGQGYSKGMQIDRIDNNKNYEPSNCKWATNSEQQRNKRNNIFITMNGETKVLQDWCNQLGVKYQLAWDRITIQGWDAVTAMTTAPIPAGSTLKKINLL
jgi:hypothetical protein